MTNAFPQPGTVQPAPAVSPPCVRCGSPVPRTAQFCLACGTPASSRSQATALGAPLAPPQSGWQPTPVSPPLFVSSIVSANYGRRVLAYLIDSVLGGAIASIIAIPILWSTVQSTPGGGVSVAVSGLPAVLIIVSGALYPLAMLFLQAFTGASLGKRFLGLRVVRIETLTKTGLGRMLLRYLIVWASSLAFAIGQFVVYLSPLWDRSKRLRGWHDRVAHTWVIDVKAGPNPLVKGVGEVVDDVSANASASASAAGAAAAANIAGNGAGEPGLVAPLAAPIASYSPAPISVPPASAPIPAPPPVPTPAPTPVTPPVPTPELAPVPVNPNVPSFPFAPASGAEGVPGKQEVAPIEGIPSFDPLPAFGGEDLDGTKLSNSIPTRALATGTVTLLFDTGESYVVAGHGVLGRDPVSPYGAANDLLVQISGDTRSISKTHIEFEVQAGSIWMTDRRSTNGSAIVRADGVESPLTPGQRMTVRSGDRVRIGTRVFTVTVAP